MTRCSSHGTEGVGVTFDPFVANVLPTTRGDPSMHFHRPTRRALATLAIVFVFGFLAAACPSAADRASDNLSEAADNFEIQRRVVFINGITDQYILEVIGLCSIADQGIQLEVTCLDENKEIRKHFLGRSDNVTYFVEQLEPADVGTSQYVVRFRPETILPEFEIGESGE